jgi:TPR repeat protein
MYTYGEGIEQNYNEALKWYQLAAKQDYADAQASLGDIYFLGQGVADDFNKSIEMYEKAIKNGIQHVVSEDRLIQIKNRIVFAKEKLIKKAHK